jgi:hypothetical protein
MGETTIKAVEVDMVNSKEEVSTYNMDSKHCCLHYRPSMAHR